MRRWEYNNIWVSGRYTYEITEELNKLGNEGWELINYKPSEQKQGDRVNVHLILKRPLIETEIEKVEDVLEQLEKDS